MKKVVISATVCLILLYVSAFYVNDAFAGAWTVPKYKVWGEDYMRWDFAKDSYNANWKLQSTQNIGAKNFREQYFTDEPKMEYGVTDWLTALASVAFTEAHYKEYERPGHVGIPSPTNPVSMNEFNVKDNGLTAVRFGGRWRLIDVPVVMSTQTKITIYPGYGINHGEQTLSGVALYEDRQHLPSVGYGNDSLDQRILIGKTGSLAITKTYKLPWYWGAEAGYVWNNRGVANGVVWFLEGGVWPKPWLLLKSELDAYKTHDGTGGFEQAYGIWRIGGVWQVFGGDSILRQGNKLFNLEFDYGLTVWGKNTAAFQEFVMKVDTQF